MNKKPLGTPVRSSFERNCLQCARWITCRNPDKNFDFACSKFNSEFNMSAKLRFEEEQDEARSFTKTKNGILLPNTQLSTKLNTPALASNYNSNIQVVDDEEDDDPSHELSAIINKVLRSGVPVPPDLRIDDNDIKKPLNVLDWMTNPNFIGGEERPFGKQIQVATHYLAEWCNRCSDEDYFECVPVNDREDDIREKVVFLNNGICPRCKKNKVELIENYDLLDPYEFVGVVGQRGSKTITATMIKSYSVMRWLTTPNLPATYGILPSTILTGTVTATTFNQAKENFWAPFDSLIATSTWFKEYHAFLRTVGSQYGEELVKHSETLLAYKHKNLFFSPASPSQRSLRGRTRIWATIDEGGWFKSAITKAGETSERMNGPEVYTALDNSLTTIKSAYMNRRNAGYFNLPKPLMTLISSPSARNDLIMTRYRESNGSPEVYAVLYPTWEFNPTITRKSLDEKFRVKPVESMRDFACEPPMAMNAWISDESLVEGSFGDKRNCVITKARRIRTKSKKLATAAEYKLVRTPNYEYGAVMAIDAGWNNNSFAIAVGYPTTIPDAEDDDDEDVFVGIEIAALVEIIPKKTHPISFTRVYNDVIKPMCEEFNVACVVSDRWQNKKIVQDLEDALGIDYFELKATINDYDDYKQCLYDEMIVHPRLDMPFDQITNMTLDDYPDCFQKSPVAHLAFQMLTVQNSGTAVVKGEDGTTDDLLRTCILAHAALQDEEILEVCLEYTNDAPQVRPGVAAIATASNRGAGTSSLNNFGVLMTRSTGGGTTNSNITSIGVRAGRK